MSFYKITDIDVSNIKFSKTKSSNGRRFINTYYNKKPLGLKLQNLRIPWDSKVNLYGQLECSFSLGKDTMLINKIQELDEQMMVYAAKEGWFCSGKELEYSPMLKQGSSSEFPPFINIKLSNKDHIIKTRFFDVNTDVISVESDKEALNLLVKNTKVRLAIECVGVWLNDTKFGLTWKAEQIRLMSQPEEIEDSFAFHSDTESDLSDLELLISDDE